MHLPSLVFLLDITYGWMIALLAVTALAWWRGAWEVKLATLACVIAWISTLLVQTWRDLAQPQLGVLLVDAMLFAALSAVAIKSSRIWPMAAAGLQLVSVTLHLVYLMTPHIWIQAYFAGLVAVSWLVLAVVAAGLAPLRRRAG